MSVRLTWTSQCSITCQSRNSSHNLAKTVALIISNSKSGDNGKTSNTRNGDDCNKDICLVLDKGKDAEADCNRSNAHLSLTCDGCTGYMQGMSCIMHCYAHIWKGSWI